MKNYKEICKTCPTCKQPYRTTTDSIDVECPDCIYITNYLNKIAKRNKEAGWQYEKLIIQND